MGGKIPNTIRRRVIMQWLYGFSRDTTSTIQKRITERIQQHYNEMKKEEINFGEIKLYLKKILLELPLFSLALFVMYAKSDLLNHKQITMIALYIHTLSFYH
jgi:hypothetical protein